MKIVVVGGHSRNVGKTSVVMSLIRGLPSLSWTAVKITQHLHGAEFLPGQVDGEEVTAPGFLLTEENNPRGQADTSRFLAAGAERALWLRFEEPHFAAAYGSLRETLEGAGHVIIESNQALEFVNPAAYIMVLDSSKTDFKPSAQRFLHRADALVLVGSTLRADAWRGIDPRLFERKPLFRAPALGEASPESVCPGLAKASGTWRGRY